MILYSTWFGQLRQLWLTWARKFPPQYQWEIKSEDKVLCSHCCLAFPKGAHYRTKGAEFYQTCSLMPTATSAGFATHLSQKVLQRSRRLITLLCTGVGSVNAQRFFRLLLPPSTACWCSVERGCSLPGSGRPVQSRPCSRTDWGRQAEGTTGTQPAGVEHSKDGIESAHFKAHFKRLHTFQYWMHTIKKVKHIFKNKVKIDRKSNYESKGLTVLWRPVCLYVCLWGVFGCL